ncbi:hypothetical protein [Specibacter sp. RAF43]|uniref:hypothetical protein n=1 Tax=Specibacter sp. RAF43 TaxID=3233057 RepID=UPI003F94C520
MDGVIIRVAVADDVVDLRLVEPDDFRSFHVEAKEAQELARAGERLLDVDGGPDGPMACAVPITLIRELAGERAADPDWHTGLEQMISYAGSKGWLLERGTAVRAHVKIA